MSNTVRYKEKGLHTTGTLLIGAGAVLLVLFALIVIWPDFESEVVGRLMPGLEQIDSLQCPLVLNGAEEAIIQAAFVNPTDEPLRLRIDSAISEGKITRTRNDTREIFIPPNETEKVTWMVSAEDAAHDRIIVARFHAYRNSAMVARASNCGIMVLDLPLLNGRHIVIALVLGVILLIGLGLFLILSERPLTRRGKRLLLQLCLFIVAISIPLLAGLFGLGLVALPLAVIPALVLISLMEHALQ